MTSDTALMFFIVVLVILAIVLGTTGKERS